ncbi:MAG: hypothetical protein A2268_02940 [Candidatus Raymondbacteria bacterium RifOxyA12_full_50_37]|uniref:DUF350 domain-containing protein n=1 Tax=Candidatus Raymondbacteria bacterium RIFOXYD12_FULL_49_13 TaxID=1817890 RepID=A0A1F7F9A1_UNCRA|nr:MAG: hypothetical protein A2248_17045 [Candidatus Raymondbacteria bacterium RIFOXYA2_FULL_49_16]OGJ90734.1 MAG: hypothetical protein A2268_02940 [Candidatus Raymondbacteria bacterium RifOxyA12_full_50_37]OGJ91711.1 MAG: hypothetical protein A2350_00350 [Candidatus Raymondbacteria bacterium RifOxyB12_full_50_8]OGJ98371.1 MAG: hypothetical protein A2453_08950 [Candidatus Raymondbacteria bacterium RIFOXYC2_FULL_50_21]OGK03096.1 MAG: hypothetical protein A2519_06780 [Candidatus Raymondbacteria b
MEQIPISFDLVVTYVINFAYMVLRAAVYAVSCFLSWFIIDKMAKIHLIKEVIDNKNTGAAIVIAALLLGLAYVIGQM